MNNNPLIQFARRPAVHIKLPSEGKDYPEGVVDIPPNGEIPIYPMTAIDEITAKTPDALFNGSAVVELIQSCVPNIKDPWMISSNDLDTILLGIKAAIGNDSLDVPSTCPNCKTENTYGVNLVAVISNIKAGDYSKTLKSGDLEIKFRPLRYKEMNKAALSQFESQKFFASLESMEDNEQRDKKLQEAVTKITLLTMDLLSDAIEYIETPETRVDNRDMIKEFLSSCDNTIFSQIRDFNANIREGTMLQPLAVKCDNCGHEYEQPYTINPSDFFG